MFLKILKMKRTWLTLLLLSPFIYIAICEINKAYWDAYVDRQCENYGGLTVVKQIDISREGFDALPRNDAGEIVINDDQDLLKVEFGERNSFKFFGAKISSRVINITDSNGVLVAYFRTQGRWGGDAILTVSGSSSHVCLELTKNIRYEEVFKIRE